MNLEELKKIREKAQKDVELRQKQSRIRIVVGMGTSGIAAGARDVLKTFVEEVSRRNLGDVVVTQTGERGLSSFFAQELTAFVPELRFGDFC